MNSSEKTIEKKLRLGIEKLGGLCLKFPATFFAGIPDRLCIMPGGLVFFVETKGEGLIASPRQLVVARKLESLGIKVYMANSEAMINDLLRSAAAVYEKPKGLTPEEEKELADLTEARVEIVAIDVTDDLNDKDLARLLELIKLKKC
jgi:hypothetical protein